MTTPRRTAYAHKVEPYPKQWAKHPTGICGEPGCGGKHFTHDLCNKHWLQHKRKMEKLADEDDPLKPTPTLKEDKRWRPEWQRRKPRRLKALRREQRAIAEKSGVVWETTATNRAAGLISKRRFILASIVERLGASFVLVNHGPEATVLQTVDTDEQFSVPTHDWDVLVRGEWIGAPKDSKTYTTTDLGDTQIAKYKNGAK